MDELNKYTCAFEPSDRSAGQFEKPSSRLYLYAIKKLAEIVLFMITIHMLIIIHKIVECSKKINVFCSRLEDYQACFNANEARVFSYF